MNDNELIERFSKGDMMSFDELVSRYDKKVLATTFRYFHNSDDAKDAYQEIFIRVYKGLRNFEYRSSFSTWLYRIATNVCLTMKSGNAVTSRTVRFSSGEEEDSSSVNINSLPGEMPSMDSAQRKETSEKISEAVSRLTPKQKMAFVLKHYEGYKIREIAEMMNAKEGTIKKYLFEAVNRLRESLKGYELL